MLSRVASAGARDALRARLPVAGGRSGRVPSFLPAIQTFHAGIPSRESAVDKPTLLRSEYIAAHRNANLFGENPRLEAIIAAGKLDRMKHLLPLGIFLMVPALCQEWYVVTEETLLMGSFFVFLGATMDFYGAGIGKYLDDGIADIKNAHNTAEDNQIMRVSKELAIQKGRLGEMEQMGTVSNAIDYSKMRRKENDAMAVPHISRENTVKLLDALKAGKIKRISELRSAEIDRALTEVAAKVSADKKLKKAALDNALQTLADPSKAAKVDPVSQIFVQYWKQKAVDMEKNKNRTMKLTKEEIAANEADIRAIYAKVGMDPTELLASLPKTYTPSTPTLFS